MRSFIVAALFAGLAIASPAPGVTDTVTATTLETITSCADTVTDCPAKATSTASALVTHTILSYEEITITSCAAEYSTECPAYTRTATHSLTTVVPPSWVAEAATPSWTAVASPVTAAPWYPKSSGTAPAAYKPWASGAAKASGVSAGPWKATKPSSTSSGAYAGPAFTGAASHLNAGAALAGVGAIAALLL